MAGLLGITVTTGVEHSQLLRSTMHTTKKIAVPIIALTTLKRGMLMAMVTATNVWGLFDPAAVDGLAIPRCILGMFDDVDVSAAGATVQAYFAGEYNDKDILWPAGITAAEKVAALKDLADRGIIVE
jgi:hypothetical protein